MSQRTVLFVCEGNVHRSPTAEFGHLSENRVCCGIPTLFYSQNPHPNPYKLAGVGRLPIPFLDVGFSTVI